MDRHGGASRVRRPVAMEGKHAAVRLAPEWFPHAQACYSPVQDHVLFYSTIADL